MEETKIGKFVVINLETMHFFKDWENMLVYYDSEIEALKDVYLISCAEIQVLEVKAHYNGQEDINKIREHFNI